MSLPMLNPAELMMDASTVTLSQVGSSLAGISQASHVDRVSSQATAMGRSNNEDLGRA